ncbi:helix-turn-helix transcriptional regulator [Paenibacillus agricola]|uniref:YafY family transcriptional regulator n=1 Tax=Paenibacillus agricola TaxID=2716264 RepID=A0ABX0J4B5_9BACL|nr:YafY family protein [Paenibacillus agricola]NHN30666.1 YafY family transcriptional regulator [Paenibacillus agricola]
MAKSKRLMELMIAINQRKKFTARELAEEFGVSVRTIMRDLQVLSELGVPLYTEYGPHGGYRVLKERKLPPITFSEQEAVAIFFAYQSLQHYGALPFAAESVSALNKFYYYLPDDTKLKIDKMKQRVVFWTSKRHAPTPYLQFLLDSALEQLPTQIKYDSKEGVNERTIQPVGVYSYNGYWYCPAFCFWKERYLLFRIDRVLAAELAPEGHRTVDLSGFPIMDWFKPPEQKQRSMDNKLQVEAILSSKGVRKYQRESGMDSGMEVNEDGTGTIRMVISPTEIEYFTSYFLGFGAEIQVIQPPIMVELVEKVVERMAKMYRPS